MNKYILSKYNHYVDTENKKLIYNSLSNKFAVLSNEQIKSISLMQCNSDVIERLQVDGFVNKEDMDEDVLAYAKFDSEINNSGLNFTILASENCNFNCVYCFEKFRGNNIEDKVVEDIIHYLRVNLRKYTSLNIHWFGGEPLLAKDKIFRMSESFIDISYQLKREYTASITTNGYLLDLQTFKTLLHNKVLTYIITIDGLPEIHDKNRPHRDGGQTFDHIINNLKQIRDNIKSNIFQIIIRTNVTMSAITSFKKYINFIDNEFGQDKRFSFLISPVYDWGGEKIQEIREKLVYDLSDFYAILLNSNIHLNFDVLSSQLRNRLCAYSRKNTYTITANGRILLCPQLNKTVFGSIDNGVLNLNHYRLAKWYSLSSEKAVRCRNCSEYNICKGKTCISNLLALDNNIISEDLPECGREYKELSNILKLLYKSNKELFIEY